MKSCVGDLKNIRTTYPLKPRYIFNIYFEQNRTRDHWRNSHLQYPLYQLVVIITLKKVLSKNSDNLVPTLLKTHLLWLNIKSFNIIDRLKSKLEIETISIVLNS